MLKKDNRQKLLKVFFEDPLPKGGHQLRGLSRKISLAPKSVKIYLEELEKENLLIKEKIHDYPVYYANIESDYYRLLKKVHTIKGIKETGLLNHLQKFRPDAIVLFGSASRGEDIKGSDIDLFLLCKQKKDDLKEYENKLGRKISIFYSESFGKLSNEFKNNIINGVVMSGYIKAF